MALPWGAWPGPDPWSMARDSHTARPPVALPANTALRRRRRDLGPGGCGSCARRWPNNDEPWDDRSMIRIRPQARHGPMKGLRRPRLPQGPSHRSEEIMDRPVE